MMKTILVTGAGRGLGRSVAMKLAAEGHHLILTARDEKAGAKVVDEIRSKAKGAKVDHYPLDLSSFASIRAFNGLLPKEMRLDVILHNAGVMQQSTTRRLSADGLEETLAVNAVGPFLLTHELLSRVGTASKTNPSGGIARIVCMSSQLHLPGSRGEPVRYDFSDPNLEHGYHPDRAYKNSKLAILWFAYELARRNPADLLTVHAMCPGFVPETAAASTTGVMHWMMRKVMPHMPFATKLDDAVDSICFTTMDSSLDNSTGDFWLAKKKFASSPQSHDLADAKRFWEWAESVTKVTTISIETVAATRAKAKAKEEESGH